MNDWNNTDDPPVTISVSRRVKLGCEKEFEAIIIGITADAMSFKGHLGANIFRPTDTENPEYRVIFKFDRMSNLRRWEESEVRQQWLKRAEPLTLGLPDTQTLTGLETWFALPSQQAIVPPPRYKMAVITWLAIYPLISIINILFAPILNPLPLLLRTLLLTVVLVSLMTYVVMPQMTKLFTKWLYPKRKLRCYSRN
jgi:uncharacterized protein